MKLLQSQRILFGFLSFFGYFAFKYDAKRYTSSTITIVYSVLKSISILSCFLYVGTLKYVSLASKFDTGSQVTALIYRMESWSMQVGLVFNIINVALNQKTLVKLFNNLQDHEQDIYALKYQLKHKMIYKKFQWISICCLITSILYFFMCLLSISIFIYPDPNFISNEVFNILIYMLCSLLSNLMIQFMIWLVLIFNFLLQTIYLNLQQLVIEMNTKKSATTLNDLCAVLKILQKLLKSFNTFSDYFGISFVGIFLSIVVITVCGIYQDYISLLKIDNVNHVKIWIYIANLILFTLQAVVCFAILCQKCESLVEKTEIIEKLLRNIEINDSVTFMVTFFN